MLLLLEFIIPSVSHVIQLESVEPPELCEADALWGAAGFFDLRRKGFRFME